MATTDNRQLISKLTFYPSEPLFAYATGYLYEYEGWETFDENVSIETMNSLISLNPSKRHLIVPKENGTSFLRWWTRPTGGTIDYSDDAPSVADVAEDFFMVLGHNFNETQSSLSYSASGVSGVVNDFRNEPTQFDGWSYMENNGNGSASQKVDFVSGNPCEVGTFVWGKKWEAPQNVDIGQSYQVKFGNKIQTTVGGKKISTMNYGGTNMWGDLHAWELLKHENKEQNIWSQPEFWKGKQYDPPRMGLRTWKVKFSQVLTSELMPQNAMINTYGWNQDDSPNYDIDDSGNSTTAITTSTDFYSNVYRRCLGSHLPIVVRISESNNNDQWAIVRISDYKVTETNPKLLNISLTLEEQV